jgi:hypothetical protein
MKYTLLGDANLDGVVNGSDFSILAANFGQGDSGADTSITQEDIQALDSFALANGLPMPTINVVPEPASAGLLAAGALGILARRRRRWSRHCH